MDSAVSTDAGVREFPCGQCGANLAFAPGVSALRCSYCGHTQRLDAPASAPIVEYSFDEALAKAARIDARELNASGTEVRCQGCGATSVVEGHADRCAFCDSPVAVEQGRDEIFRPESLLPFAIERKEARERFRSWLKKLWFAPSDLARNARRSGIEGAYLPYWTYDSQTFTRYVGQRGEHYYETESYTDDEGKTRTRRVQKTRWYPASGMVQAAFDNVLICATETLPRTLIRKLEPWDLDALVPFSVAYLAGFQALRYDVDLKTGFGLAERRMEDEIRRRIHRDIGGDVQRIASMNVRHQDVRFKHLLLPVWISSFRYGEKVYRFVVNARTGEVQGERPWSWVKIGAAVLAAAAIAAGLWYAFGQS
ncbi:MAG TPA: hypothetical protein RMG48_01005 [Myxococcales bacterium LLY-WYZ-16_1]|nr:hypothetical protein [Myxococcales bacterium LLY-WYZ-16_1]